MSQSELFYTTYGTHKIVIRFQNEGSAAEEIGVRGTRHLFEHLKCKHIIPLMDELEEVGVTMNAFTSSKDIAFWISGLPEYVSQVADKWAAAVMNIEPVSKELFEKEIRIVSEEIQGGYADPSEGTLTNLIASHFNEFGPGGKISEFESFTYEQYLELLTTFKQATAVYEIGESRILNMDIVGELRAPRELSTIVQYNPLGDKRNQEVLNINRVVGGIFLPRVYTKRTPEYHAMDLAMDCLNGNWKSPIFNTIREVHNLTYHPSHGFYGVGVDQYVPVFCADTNRDNGEFMRTVYQELLDKIDTLVTEDRFALNKRSTIIYYKKASLDIPGSLYRTAMDPTSSFEELIKRTELVTYEDVLNATKVLAADAVTFLGSNGYEG